MNQVWDWGYAWEVLPILAQAAVITLQVTIIGFFLALLIGLIFAAGRLMGPRWVQHGFSAIVEFIRSTPLLIQIFFLYYVLPDYGIAMDAYLTGVIALGLHYGAYCAEVYRSGLENVPKGQWEAAHALNLGSWTTFKDIILPQAIPPIVPALGNYLVALFKETPLLSAIAVLELMQTAKILGSESFQYTEPITIVGLFFLLFSLVCAYLIRRVEARLRTHQGVHKA